MKISQLKTIVKEAVKEAIQDELKDILLEAVRAPKQVIQSSTPQTKLPEQDKVKLRENMMGVLNGMRPGANGNISATTNDMPLQVTNADTASPNGQLPQGNVSMDQIMGLMNKR